MRFKSHDDLETPHGNTIVWRYMSLEKYLDLITQRRLFFTNAENFTDGYEISLPQNLVKAQRKKLEEQGLEGRELEEELAQFEYANQPMRNLTLVNCWSMGRHESYALWKIYLSGAKAGVAIRTSFSKVKKAITHGADEYPEDIYAGSVQYQNYMPEGSLSRFRMVTSKREFYSYEQELRLFILHYPRSEGGTKPPYNLSAGRHVAIDLNTLVDEIYMSPFVAKWFGEVLEKVTSKVAPELVPRLQLSSIRDE